jgi:hypothetical protein
MGPPQPATWYGNLKMTNAAPTPSSNCTLLLKVKPRKHPRRCTSTESNYLPEGDTTPAFRQLQPRRDLSNLQGIVNLTQTQSLKASRDNNKRQGYVVPPFPRSQPAPSPRNGEIARAEACLRGIGRREGMCFVFGMGKGGQGWEC